MKERPILFSGPMVRAILDGRKTQTRRAFRNQGKAIEIGMTMESDAFRESVLARCPYGQPGDRLWVRETWRPKGDGKGWRSPIHMPRWASRLTLELTEIRVQRVQEISEEDAIAEGVQLSVSPEGRVLTRITGPVPPAHFCERSPEDWTVADHWRFEFANLWDSPNAKRGHGWDANPWVWALTFRVVP